GFDDGAGAAVLVLAVVSVKLHQLPCASGMPAIIFPPAVHLLALLHQRHRHAGASNKRLGRHSPVSPGREVAGLAGFPQALIDKLASVPHTERHDAIRKLLVGHAPISRFSIRVSLRFWAARSASAATAAYLAAALAASPAASLAASHAASHAAYLAEAIAAYLAASIAASHAASHAASLAASHAAAPAAPSSASIISPRNHFRLASIAASERGSGSSTSLSARSAHQQANSCRMRVASTIANTVRSLATILSSPRMIRPPISTRQAMG